MKTLKFLLCLFVAGFSASSLADDRHDDHDHHDGFVFCTSSNDNLLMNDTAVLHDFSNPAECARAVGEARQFRAFCTSRFDNLLKSISGDLIYDFSSPQACQRALTTGGKNGHHGFVFCTSSNDNLLMNGTAVLHDFSKPTDCARAAGESRQYGAFCTSRSDNLLKSIDGDLIYDFSSPQACQRALLGTR